MTICASCGRDFEAASDSEHLCPQCAAESQHSAPALAAPAPSRFRRSLESPTVVLVALNTLVYLIMAIEGHNFLNFDVKRLFLSTHASFSASPVTASVNINPWLIGTGVGIRF